MAAALPTLRTLAASVADVPGMEDRSEMSFDRMTSSGCAGLPSGSTVTRRFELSVVPSSAETDRSRSSYVPAAANVASRRTSIDLASPGRTGTGFAGTIATSRSGWRLNTLRVAYRVVVPGLVTATFPVATDPCWTVRRNSEGAVRLAPTSGCTSTVAVRVAVPAGPLAVSVYVVVAVGVTETLEPVTTPMPEIESEVAFETTQDSVALCPAGMLAGEAVKDAMAGAVTPPLPELEPANLARDSPVTIDHHSAVIGPGAIPAPTAESRSWHRRRRRQRDLGSPRDDRHARTCD